MASKQKQRLSVLWRVGILAGLLGIVATILVLVFNQQSKQSANNFEQCRSAGGVILETYPEQCRLDGKLFTNEAQLMQNSGEAYVGLLEQDALNKASEMGKVARVVKRDDEDLPVTMDFSPWRLNLYVQDGKVYMVQVEGQ